MRLTLPIALAALLAASAGSSLSGEDGEADKYWPQWRGPLGTGVSNHADPPVAWAENKNVKWKIEVPGRGSASPVVWGDTIFLLTAVPAGVQTSDSHAPRGGVSPRVAHTYRVLAINRSDGTIAWERTAREEIPHEASHQDNG
ncbi:MAG: hypothetical protein ACRD1H_16185, partial [Vicinamibacterales bacterium]